MSSEAEVQPLPGIILDQDDDNKELGIGADLDGDGKADINVKLSIKDPTVWAVIGWIIAGVSIARNLNIW